MPGRCSPHPPHGLALATVPLHPMNFSSNGGRDDLLFVYLPLAIAAGPVAWVVSFTPIGSRSAVAYVAFVAAVLMFGSLSGFSMGFEGPYLTRLARDAGIVLAAFAALVHVVVGMVPVARDLIFAEDRRS